MRISKNDVLVDVYTPTFTENSEGYKVATWTRILEDVGMDLQPIGPKVNLNLYGLDKTAAGARQAFFDLPILNMGMVVSSGGTNYMVKGVHDWYTHSEAILEPFEVVLP